MKQNNWALVTPRRISFDSTELRFKSSEVGSLQRETDSLKRAALNCFSDGCHSATVQERHRKICHQVGFQMVGPVIHSEDETRTVTT